MRVLSGDKMDAPSLGRALATDLLDLEELSPTTRLKTKAKIWWGMREGPQNKFTSMYTLNEDLFWSDRAKLFYPDFKIAPIDIALKFAFEAHPRCCFERNKNRLPFGCHAWAKWDRAFWESMGVLDSAPGTLYL